MRKSPGILEKGFTVISLMMYSGGPLTVILSNGYSQGEGVGQAPKFDYTLIRIIFQLIYCITLILVLSDWKKVLHSLFKEKTLLLLVGMAAISFTWSSTPEATLNSAVALIGTTFFGIYFATRYTMQQQLQLLGWMFGLIVVLSFGFALLLPKYGIMSGVHSGKWRGIYTHKNVLGKTMVLGSAIFWLLTVKQKKISLIALSFLVLTIALLVLSTSASSLINLVVLLLASIGFRALWLRGKAMIPIFSVAIILTIGIVTNVTAASEVLLGSVDKDTTLTGRTEIWAVVIDKIHLRPWLGYGFDGFWQGINSEGGDVWRAIGGWSAPNAHNGVLDVFLSLGLIGVIIISIGFLMNLVRSLNWVRLSKSQQGLWPILFMIYMVISNTTETSLLVQNSIYWILYVAITVSLVSPLRKTASLSGFNSLSTVKSQEVSPEVTV